MVSSGPPSKTMMLGAVVVSGAAAPAAAREFTAAKVSSMQRDTRSLAAADELLEARADVGTARRIGARLFTLHDDVWTDARAAAPAADRIRKVKVRSYSSAYFALLREIPELGEPFGLGDRVLVFGRAVAIEVAADGDERLSEAQVAAVSADW